MVIHVIHVSGKRMIAQGTDGVSRGFLMEGVMAGDDMLSICGSWKVCFGKTSAAIRLDYVLGPRRPDRGARTRGVV